MDTAQIPERAARQAALLPPDKLDELHVTIVGVGAIGRQVALQLAAAGQKHIQLFDFDTVEEANLGPQGYFMKDIGESKVESTKKVMELMNPEGVFVTEDRRIGKAEKLGDVLFSCVDSIKTRQNIWERYGEEVKVFIDGRMAAETLRIVSACDEASRAHYPETLFGEEEAYEGACTARSTIFTSNIAAGMMVQQYSKWLRGMVVDQDVLFNLLAMEVITDL